MSLSNRLTSFAVLAFALVGCGESSEAPAVGDDEAVAHHGDGASADPRCSGPLSTVVSAVPPSTGGGATPINVTVHYNRPDGQYAGWGLHVWQINDGGQFIADYPGVTFPNPLAPAGFDDYGPVFQIEASKFTAAAAAG